jgi:hypothetical protein
MRDCYEKSANRIGESCFSLLTSTNRERSIGLSGDRLTQKTNRIARNRKKFL